MYIHRTIKELILEKCEVTGDPDDIKPAHTLEDEVIDNEIEDIIGTYMALWQSCDTSCVYVNS